MNFREKFGAWFSGDQEREDQNLPEDPEIKNASSIEKPTDEDLLAKLERKLEEYKGRSKDSLGVYKIAVLEALLNEGSADYNVLKDRLSAQMGDIFLESNFSNAFKVIKAYVSGDMEGVYGGTGLK